MTNSRVTVARTLSAVAVVLGLLAAPAAATPQDKDPASSKSQITAAIARQQNPEAAARAASAEESTESEKQPAAPPAADSAPSANSTTKATAPPQAASCKRTIKANVVAIAQPYMLNRLGASMPNAALFALESDVDMTKFQLKSYKRARPIVLRANVGDCLQVTLKNRINQFPTKNPSNGSQWNASFPIPNTPQVSLHVQGVNLVNVAPDGSQCKDQNGNVVPCYIDNDGSFVGQNNTSLANKGEDRTYNLYAARTGTFLLYSLGDANTTGQPINYLNNTQTLMIGQLALGLIGAVNVQPETAEWYRSQVTREDLEMAIDRSKGNNGFTSAGQPIINYDAVYPQTNPRAGMPILKMLDSNFSIVHTDLTAIITGPNKGRFAGVNGPNQPDPPCSLLNDPNNQQPVDPNFCVNPALPDRKQPYREITVIYHEVSNAAQAFSEFSDPQLSPTVGAGMDSFAINYGTGGIGAEILANRKMLGPAANCIDCKYEEFFLSSWPLGDPAMVVDNPVSSGTRATKAVYLDDPSNVYHSYLNDHVTYRVLHGGNGVTHVHHQHAGQWLQTPNSDQSNYFDSQMISPGASYSLEYVYNGSGNLNKTAGDWIYHCHFYPHFAGGMWAMWRIHDVFEMGTVIDKTTGLPSTDWNRVLPDGEIVAGTPIPAIVPLPTLAMAPMPARVKICPIDKNFDPNQSGSLVGTACPQSTPNTIGYVAVVNQDDFNRGMPAGFPFFIPGIAGARAPHPPLDFAPEIDENGSPIPGQYLDGGLPRHIVTGGQVVNNQMTKYDWSKDFYINCGESDNFKYIAGCNKDPNQKIGFLNAVQLPEAGTVVEQSAMKYFGTRQHASFTPDNQPGQFLVNGLPRKPSQGYFAANQFGSQFGAPFADPGVDINGNVAGGKTPRRYKGAAFQSDISFNRGGTISPTPSLNKVNSTRGWHYPQQRILSLWEDVVPTQNYNPNSPNQPGTRAPEPLFIRANSGEVVEFWHTNLVPSYYLADDFQVRTPTDIIGQHIHLVKFDVVSSDGAANGYNYEDGTFAATEVQEIIHAINNAGGSWKPVQGGPTTLSLKPPPAGIIDCANPANSARCQRWAGAQTTVQRWYADPLLDNKGTDRTIGTVFTHDHFGPSTHQQAGLYAGLLTEPAGSTWKNPETGAIMGGAGVRPPRDDGGPTSWKADIIAGPNSFREFALEFQDFQLAYSRTQPAPNPWPSNDPSVGYRVAGTSASANVQNPPGTPSLVSSGAVVGTFSLNYLSEPVAWRVGQFGDLSQAFNSTLTLASGLPANGDPVTPLLRAYQNDTVKIRTLVGAHQMAHFFTMHGVQWLSESAWKNSGYRSTQAMGLSEHNEIVFKVPPSTPQKVNDCPDNPGAPCSFVDHLYIASAGDNGLTNGLWGLMRAYDPTQQLANLQPLPNNPLPVGKTLTYATCPANATVRNYSVTATTAQQALSGGTITYNSRNAGTTSNTQLNNPLGIIYVFSSDLDSNGKLKAGIPIEPLILRANAGDCVNVWLTNGMSPTAKVLQQQYTFVAPFDAPAIAGNQSTVPKYEPSQKVGLHAQKLSYDLSTSDGVNAGYNTSANQVASIPSTGQPQPVKYQWYAGIRERDASWNLKYIPIEFGSANLTPADPLLQHINGLYGAIIIEPAGSTWTCDGTDANGNPKQVDCYPTAATTDKITSRASATITAGAANFREFVAMINEDLKMQAGTGGQTTGSAINYKTEPTFFRFGNTTSDKFSKNGVDDCSVSNRLVGGNPQTPIFTAKAGTPVRFRMLHPPGTGIVQVMAINGHNWQASPYVNDSTQMGNNKLSNWLGSVDNVGATAHYDVLIESAGGPFNVPGDYFYSAFVPAKSEFGMWGVFRVLDENGNMVIGANTSPTCKQTTARPALVPKRGVDRLDSFRLKPATKDASR